jgi:hypothetical protein
MAPEHDAPLSVTLSLPDWRALLEQLALGQFRTVAPLIGAIEQQCNRQLMRRQGRPYLAPEDYGPIPELTRHADPMPEAAP